jgi:hypothetical protein
MTIGIPTDEIGMAGSKAGIATMVTDENGRIQFVWRRDRLDAQPPKFLEALLTSLRQAIGVTQ